MSVWSVILLLLSAFYLFGAIFEFPIMFEGNPKSRWLMQKIGKRNLRVVIIALGIIFAVLAMII